jgi:hypothetical protein
LVEKRVIEKNKDCLLLKFECFEHEIKKKIVSSFEHINFAINGNYSKKIYDNSNYYASLVFFLRYKIAILRNVHSLGRLL